MPPLVTPSGHCGAPARTHFGFAPCCRGLTRALVRLGITVLVLALGRMPLAAQSNADGFIFGTVSSATPGSTTTFVVARNVNSGAERSVRPAADGSYRILFLPVGRYDVFLREADQNREVISSVAVRLGIGVLIDFGPAGQPAQDVVLLDAYRVEGAAISPGNIAQTESTILLDARTLEQVPVHRDVTGVALLAPGVIRGDDTFTRFNMQRTASFGGASPAENASYINGFNVANFRNGLGGSTVPFSFYEEFQIKTGGFGAEFGRSTGGVINATTKRGGNVMHGGLTVHHEPAAFRGRSPDVFLANGTPLTINRKNISNATSTEFHVSGPLVRDRLFFYGLYNLRLTHDVTVEGGATQLADARDNDPFWAAKLDWQVHDNHLLEVTGFSDRRDRVEGLFTYNLASGQRGARIGNTHHQRGGDNWVLRYSGQLSERFSVSALAGRGVYDLSNRSDDDTSPVIYGENGIPLGTWTNFTTGTSRDRRTAYRLSSRLQLPGHVVSAGFELERNNSLDALNLSGGVFWQYFAIPPNGDFMGIPVPPGTTLVVAESHFRQGGNFRTDNSAWYLEDEFSLWNERLHLRAGVRSESFANRNQNNRRFIHVTNELAPRLGFALVLDPRRGSRIFGHLGRYHLPVAANVNVRKAGGTFASTAVYAVTSRNSDGTPQKGTAIIPTMVQSDGTIPDYRTQTNLDVQPTHQDEIILGFQTRLAPRWTFTVRGIHRRLRALIEDVRVGDALASYAARNGIATYAMPGAPPSILTNPGEDVRMFWDLHNDGTLDEIVLRNDLDIHLPRARRNYYAIELQLEKAFSDRWFLQASYTWSQSYGNTEGAVRSDLRQADSGTTASFDAPVLQINSDGWLPNDRRHSFKAFGRFQWNEKVTLGASAYAQSGRAINALGNPPDPRLLPAYAGTFFEVPQGSAGNSPWLFNCDVSVSYQATTHLRLGLTIFNLFDFDRETRVFEVRTDASGQPDPRYRRPWTFQSPRSLRASATIEF